MRWLSLLVAVVLVVCLVPLAYTQAAEVTGKFTLVAKPAVNALDIYQNPECTQVANSMDPQSTYYAKVTITSPNNLSALTEVKVTIFYDQDGSDPDAPGSGNTQTCAILTWTASPEGWSISSGSPTTWDIVTGACSRPANLNVKTGDWIFAFKPGKVATESATTDDWDGKATTTNNTGKTAFRFVRDKEMNFYGEVTGLTTDPVDWGEVEPGLLFTDSANPKTGIAATYIANGDYAATISATDWEGDQDGTAVLDEEEQEPPTGDNEFALKANDEDDYDSAVWVKKTANNISESGAQTGEAGVTVDTNALWLSLSESWTNEPQTYSGAIYYGIANR